MYTKYIKIFSFKISPVSTQKSILETTLQSILTVVILGDRWGQCTPLTSSLEHGPCYSYEDTMLEIIAAAVTDFMRTARWGAGVLLHCFPVVVALSVMASQCLWVHSWHSAVHTHRLECQATSCSPSFQRKWASLSCSFPHFCGSPLFLLAPVPLPQLCPLPFLVSSHPGHLCLLTVLSVVCPFLSVICNLSERGF